MIVLLTPESHSFYVNEAENFKHQANPSWANKAELPDPRRKPAPPIAPPVGVILMNTV